MLRTIVLGVCVCIVGCLGSGLEVLPLLQDSRIVGGSEVDIRNHPHQVSLQTSSHICGASIISSKWVVTAAHCVGSPASRYSLRVGNNDKNLGVRYGVKSIVRHPNYNSRTVDFDIALIQIDGEIKFNNNVQPVTLASSEPSVGNLVNVTGWGAMKEGGSTSSQLMSVSVPIVSRAQCQNVYKNLNVITDRMICAGYTSGGKDSCQGDSGGPLTSGRVQYGIVSWGYGCAKPSYPGVYTNVASLRSWVKSISGI